jgi:sugar-specific transcriptional regulator TrmB
MEAEELINIGLTKNQAITYLEILKHPGQSAGKIAKNLSIDRSFTYGIINSLIDKGLVNYTTKENAKLYYTSDPENLLKDIEEKKNKIKGIVEELKNIKGQTNSEKSVFVYEGRAGLKAFAKDILDSNNILTIGGGGNLKIFEALEYEYPHYLKEIKEKQIKGKLITSEKNKKTLNKSYENSKVEIKSFEGLESGVSFSIYKNKLAIYCAEEKPYVIIIENEDISKALKAYFNKTWNFAK